MRPTSSLLLRLPRLTLFTRTDCALCLAVREQLKRAWDLGARFEYREVDVLETEKNGKKGAQWKEEFQNEVPVVQVEAIRELEEMKERGELDKEGEGVLEAVKKLEAERKERAEKEEVVWEGRHRMEAEDVVKAVEEAGKRVGA